MLHDPANLVQAEDVNPGVVVVSRPVLEAMENDVVVFAENPLGLDY
jgi:hypothetical protein